MKRKITTLWSPRDGDQKTQEVKQVRFCETPFPLLAVPTRGYNHHYREPFVPALDFMVCGQTSSQPSQPLLT